MENASKALLIAGAILIAILLIALGMMAYTAGKATTDKAVSNLDSTQVSTFNSKFLNMEGKRTGSEVISLLNTVASNNSDSKSPKTDISIKYGATGTESTATMTSTPSIISLKKYVKINSDYTVTCNLGTDGLVSSIEIKGLTTGS